MTTTSWQTRKYVPDSDDEDEEDLIIAKNKQWNAVEGYAAGFHDQQEKGSELSNSSHTTKTGYKQEERQTQNRAHPLLDSREITLENAHRSQGANVEVRAFEISSELGNASSQVLRGQEFEHSEGHEAQEASFPANIDDLSSISSSPLSSIHGSPTLPQSFQLQAAENLDVPAEQLDRQVISDEALPQDYRPGRQLRERKAIQLNPYAIEGQLYKQAWKSRGLVPLQVKNHSQLETNNETQLSSSQLEYQSESDAGNNLELHTEDELEHSADILPGLDNEFPPLESISGLRTEAIRDRSPKRRKLNHTYSKKSQLQAVKSNPGGFHVREDGWIEVPFAEDKTPVMNVRRKTFTKGKPGRPVGGSQPGLITPISASRSSTASSPGLSHGRNSPGNPAVFDEETISKQTYTPITSSEIRPQHGRRLVKKRDLNRLSPGSTRSDKAISVVAVSSTSESEDEADRVFRQITTAQKRTKGVLPASWHRLEYQKLLDGRAATTQKQPPASSRHRPRAASPSLETKKGVAKRITSTHRRTIDNNSTTAFGAFIDSDSDEEEVSPSLPDAKIQQDINDFLTIDDQSLHSDDSNMEDNGIDAMTNRHYTSRPRKTYTKATKQPKIRDYLPQQENIQNLRQRPSASNHDKSRKSSRKHASMPRNKHNRVLSILSAAERLGREETPKFLAFAVRTVKQKREQAQRQRTRQPTNVSATRHRKAQKRTSKSIKSGPYPTSVFQQLSRAPLQERSLNNPRVQRFANRDNSESESGQDAIQQQAHSFSTGDEEQPNQRIETEVDEAVPPKDRGKFLRKGHPIASTTASTRTIAPAQLETINSDRRRQHSVLQGRRFVLDTFLQRSADQRESTPAVSTPLGSKTTASQRQRKRRPKQMPIVAVLNDDQISSSETIDRNARDVENEPARPSISSKLQSLQLPVQTEYTITFSASRLPDGGHFHASTLLGSGLFADSLKTQSENRSHVIFRSAIDGETIKWSEWNEAVAQQIIAVCDRAVDLAISSEEMSSTAAPGDSVEQLTIIVRYLATYLKFLDAIDRRDFVSRWTTVLKKYESRFSTDFVKETPKKQDFSPRIGIVCLLAVIANQVRLFAQDDMIEQNLKKSISEVSMDILKCSLRAVFRNGFKDFRSFSQDPVNLSNHVSRSKISRKIEALVILFHSYQSFGILRQTFWDVLKEQSCLVCPPQINFSTLELAWQDMFSLLPVFELDSRGQAAPQAAFPPRIPNWKLVKQLIEPVFAAYTNFQHRSVINQYCWALYARCHRLLDYWGWHDCESIMGFLFDFFAQNKLHDLRMELNPGSPNILADPGSATALVVRNSDRCFQVLLKLVGRGIKTMRLQRNDKRIGNCVWRLTPNHDRSLPKDQALRQEDLDAVRNHLDLLAVLYWAAPPQYRIRVEVIQNLIDIGNSHKEVCYLVIEKWHDLVAFQLSTQESPERLDVFVQWYEEVIHKLLRLYQLARTEVESDARQAATLRGQHFTVDEQERIIQASQHNVQSVLVSAFSSLKNAISQVHMIEGLQRMLPDGLSAVFRLWDANQPRTSQIIAGALDVIRAWIRRAQELDISADSQDYGDWTAFDELVPEVNKRISILFPENLRQVLQAFFANLFGSELAVEGDLLHDSMQCWLEIAELDIKADLLTWDDLIDPYNPRSWNLLRDTPQTRTFTPLFYASLLRREPALYERKKSVILQQWVACLLERESHIKYQSNLTSELFNQDVAEPLFQNQPFQTGHGVFDISLIDFIGKRTSLLACILSNMRESLSFSVYHQLQDCQAKRKSYSELLRHLMDTLKNNFLSLGQQPDLQEGYVKFAQRIVQLLQEHTADICKIDGFFLDAVTFPLPTEDPEYLVSKLKSLVSQSGHNRSLQQLGAFVQSLCERAVMEGRQEHFARLIYSATEDVYESGREEQLTLRQLICCQILPDYIDAATNTHCGWVIADPILLCVAPMLQTISWNMDPFNPASLAAGQSIISTSLNAVCGSIGSMLSLQPDFDTKSIALLTRCFGVVKSALESWDLLTRYAFERSRVSSGHDLALAIFFVQSAIYTIAKLESLDPIPSAPTRLAQSQPNTPALPTSAARTFILDALFTSLSTTSRKCKWRFENEKLFVHRNARWDIVKFTLDSRDERKQALLHAAQSLIKELQKTSSFGGPVSRIVLDAPYDNGLLQGKQERIYEESYFI